MVDSVSVRFKNARVEKMPLNIRLQWNAGTTCVSECVLNQGKKKHININKFGGLSRDWVGAKICLCVFFLRVIPYGGENTQTKSPPKSRDNPVKCLFMCFFFMCFFAPNLKTLACRGLHVGPSKKILVAGTSLYWMFYIMCQNQGSYFQHSY